MQLNDLNLLKVILTYKKPSKHSIRLIFNYLNNTFFHNECPKFGKIEVVETLKDSISDVYGMILPYKNDWMLKIDVKENHDFPTLLGTVAHEMIHRIQAHLKVPIVENDLIFKKYKKEFKKIGINV